jgi:energy-coupling factor transporter ATP-binding protein EcfA2
MNILLKPKMPILNDIIDWIENKPVFWQIGIERLIRNNNLTDSDISDMKEICKSEFGLSNFAYTPVDFDSLKGFAESSNSGNSIILSKIYNIDNINALSKSNTLEFAPKGLTVVYGDNGAGKSSYVIILKHVCNTRGHKPLINGNLYELVSFGNAKRAEVEYSLDGINFNSVSLNNNEISGLDLKRVDVFDAFSANHYIENEDEIAFIPHGLSIIEKFATYIQRVEYELNLELQSPALAKFDYLTILEVGEATSAKNFLTKLSANTILDELRAEAQWNETKHERVIELNELIFKLKATDPKKELKDNEEKIERFKILINKFRVLEDSLSGESLVRIKSILNKYVSTSEALKASSEKIFSGLSLDGIGSDSWKLLWESARKFYNESKNQELFPETENVCPLCLQDLNFEARVRFNNFEEFVKNDIQQEYNNALVQYNSLVSNLNELSFDFQDQEPTVNELDEIIEDYRNNQGSYLEQLSNQKDYLTEQLASKIKVESFKDFIIGNSSKADIEVIVKDLEASNVKLKTQSISDALNPLEKELNQLNGEKKIFDFKPKLAREIYRQRKIGLLNKCIGKCNTRAITTLSNDLTASYISQSLKQSFKEELKKLGFSNIKIETETKGAKGKQYHFLRLDEPNCNNVALKDILSEGEHRCISLATFLAELSLSDHKSSIIFDDPVSSLDHKWRNRIAKRIAEESKNRQVIIFTHDITFLLMLQEHSEDLSCDLEIKSLTRKKTETGIIASNPPWDALPVGKRIGILKSDYQIIEKIERTETSEVYKEKAKFLYGKLRETWERSVEEVLFNGAIQRFGREIQTQRIKAIVDDLTSADYGIIESNMTKCSTYFCGHDSSGTLIEEIPNSAEFLEDVKVLEQYIKELRERRQKKK